MPRVLVAIPTFMLLLVATALPATAQTVEDEMLLVSRSSGSDGVKGDSDSFNQVVSADGRIVAFESIATNLHPDDIDVIQDVFVRDSLTHETILASRANGLNGEKGNSVSSEPTVSADGRYVAFWSGANNLHPDDIDDISDIFLRDLVTNQTVLVSRASGADGAKGNFLSAAPSISADGRYVAFDSNATNLHSDDADSTPDVFVRDLQTQETILVSRATGAEGEKANDFSFNPSISADGRYVVF